jgi:hypothetical protein
MAAGEVVACPERMIADILYQLVLVHRVQNEPSADSGTPVRTIRCVGKAGFGLPR